VLLAKGETVLQGMIDRLIYIGKCYGNETNVEKSTVMGFTREPSTVHVVTDPRKLKNVEYLKNLGKLTTNDSILYVIMNLEFPCKISVQQDKGAFCSRLE